MNTTQHHLPVESVFRPDSIGGWQSTGLTFDDYSRMYTLHRKPSGERRLPTPRWALNDPMLRELLVRALEERAYRKRPAGKGSLSERLAAAQAKIAEKRKGQIVALEGICKRYVKLRQEFPNCSFKFLEVYIEGLDTLLNYTATDGGLATIGSVVFLYYRAKLDSVGVGLELHIKPTHVRQLLFRIFQTAAGMAATHPEFADSLRDLEEARAIMKEARLSLKEELAKPKQRFKKQPTNRPQPGTTAIYRGAPVEVLEINGKFVRIKNAKNECLTIEAKNLQQEDTNIFQIADPWSQEKLEEFRARKQGRPCE